VRRPALTRGSHRCGAVAPAGRASTPARAARGL